jgi:hypothetical protein|nr:MAG TPA: Site-specific recombinase [Caudoviricetes sp.]
MVRQFRTVEEANEFIEEQDKIIKDLNDDIAVLNAELDQLEEQYLDQGEYAEELEYDLRHAEIQIDDMQDVIDEMEAEQE